MPLIAPKLDDRQFQDLVDEAKQRIPHYCQEWTDHNVSDPGVTLIELFAWMTDLLLYRLNQVPERHAVTFMNMLGIRLQEAVAATARVTFWLTAAQETAVTIPAGTEVATTQTETERSITFTTDTDFQIVPPQLTAVLSRIADEKRSGKRYQVHNLRRLVAGFEGVGIFSDEPVEDDALYLGFANNLSDHVLRVQMDCDPAGGAGVDPSQPPTIWEVSTGKNESRWQPCTVELDTTRGLNSAGHVQVHLPSMGLYKVNDQALYWLRVRLKAISEAEKDGGMRPYRLTPRLRQLCLSSWGGTAVATHARLVQQEFLGRSDGTPGQRFQLQRAPVIERSREEHLIVQADGQPPQAWSEVPDFAGSGAYDRHYTLDSNSGELRFGPALRQPDGTMKLYGDYPPRGANLFMKKYRTGGGVIGNVRRGELNTLKTAIPYVARVSNRESARGGLDGETLEAAKMRVPALLRTRDRAVTEADYEFLAHQAVPEAIGRVKCLQPRPTATGQVKPGRTFLLVIPRAVQPCRHLTAEELTVPAENVARLQAYLDERRLLTTRLSVREPDYYYVAIKVTLCAVPGADEGLVEQAVLARLYRYLNPLTGGPEGTGWPFGRDIFVGDVYQSLQGLPDVQFIRGVEMYAVPPGGHAKGDPAASVSVLEHGLVASGIHQVEFE